MALSAPVTALVTELGAGFPFTEELRSLTESVSGFRNRVMDFAVDHPTEALITLVIGSSWMLYQAEKDTNDGINTLDDAVHYIATCLTVGYANIFPVTPRGKLIASAVMMFGPSIAAWQVEGRLTAREAAAPPAPPHPAQDLTPVVEKLDAILKALEALQTQPPAQPT